MDEEEISRAIDRLNAEGAPGDGDPGLLGVARAVRGLRPPEWPEDSERFVGRLLPRPRMRLASAFSVAAAILVAALLVPAGVRPQIAHGPLVGFALTPPPVVQSAASPTKSLSLGASSQTPRFGPVQNGVGTPSPVASMPNFVRTPAAVAVAGIERTPGTPGTVRIRLVLGSSAKIQPAADLSDLFGHRRPVHLALQSRPQTGARVWSIAFPSPAAPGWYLLAAPGLGQEIAFLIPYASGETIEGSAAARHSAAAASGSPRILSVHYTATFTRVYVAGAGWGARAWLRGHGMGREVPLLETGPTGPDGTTMLAFDPLPSTSGETQLVLLLQGGGRSVLTLPTP